VGLLDRQQLAKIPVQPVVGVLPDRAGVEDHDVGFLTCRFLVAGRLQEPGEPLGMVAYGKTLLEDEPEVEGYATPPGDEPDEDETAADE